MITSASNPGLADQAVAFHNAITAATLTGMANVARLMRGHPPVELPAGPATAHEVVGAREGVRLLRYHAKVPHRGNLMLVASLINRYYVLDLLEEMSVVDGFCRQGFDVFVLDWQPPGRAGLDRTFADYVDGFIPWGISQAAGQDAVHVLGYCMGGTLAAIHAARHPQQVRTLSLLGAPIDFHKSGVLATFTKPAYFDADLVVDALGNVPPVMLQAAFKSMTPSNLFTKFLDLSDRADDLGAVRHFLAVERWLEDNLSFPGGLYRPYIRELYQENRLVDGTLSVGGRTVHLADISMPVLNILGLKDNIVKPDGARAIMPLLGSTDAQVLEFDTGHIGLTTSKRAHRDMWPRVHAWMLERC